MLEIHHSGWEPSNILYSPVMTKTLRDKLGERQWSDVLCKTEIRLRERERERERGGGGGERQAGRQKR